MIVVHRSSIVSPDKVNTMVSNVDVTVNLLCCKHFSIIIKGAKIFLIEAITSKAVYKT